MPRPRWEVAGEVHLVQLHHKVETFEHLNKKLVLVVQDRLLAYMTEDFAFGHMSEPALNGDPMHFHSDQLSQEQTMAWRLDLAKRISTDTAGVGAALGLQVSAKVEMKTILAQLSAKRSKKTLFELGRPITDVSPKTEPS